jgi:hypothetical protein
MTTIFGSIDQLKITNTGNGNTIAHGLTAKDAQINRSGNITVTVSRKIIAKASWK